MAPPVLRLNEVHTYYGESHVLQGISFHVDLGECVCLLGANGMGKTTTMSTIIGITPARRGSIFLEDLDITHSSPWTIARQGIGYVPEDRGIFDALTTVENLKIPYLNSKGRGKKPWDEQIAYIHGLFPGLKGRETQLAGSLSGGEQQMLSVARGLISGSKMLLLDEPFKGLAPSIVRNVIEVIKKLKDLNKTILMVEEKMSLASEFSDRFYFLMKGCITGEEKFATLKNSPDIFSQYLGIKNQSSNPE